VLIVECCASINWQKKFRSKNNHDESGLDDVSDTYI
jgi:hypothetical protein